MELLKRWSWKEIVPCSAACTLAVAWAGVSSVSAHLTSFIKFLKVFEYLTIVASWCRERK